MSANEKENNDVKAENDLEQTARQTTSNAENTREPEAGSSDAASVPPPAAENGQPETNGGHSRINLSKEDEEAPRDSSTRASSAPDAGGTETPASWPVEENAVESELEGRESAGELTRGKCLVLFNALSHVGPLALLVFLGLMVWGDYWFAMTGDALYCPPEATAISAFLNSGSPQNLLAPSGLSAGVLAAQWPGLVWLASLLALIPIPPALLWPLTGSLCAALALLATWQLAKFCRFGSKVAFASGLVLLCTPVFAPLGHFVGRGALAAACVVFALACFTRGWLKKSAWIALPLAFVATALGGLTGGPWCIILPLLASICFLIWIGRPGRASRGDAVFGFILLLCILGAWFGSVILTGENNGYLESLLGNVWVSPWPLAADWWLSAALILLGALPWTILVICVSWIRVGKESRQTLGASRRDNGSAMLWIALVAGWLLTFAISGSLHLAVVASVCILAVLLGKAFLNLPRAGHRLFFIICAIGLFCAGIFILALSFEFSQSLVLPLLPFQLPTGVAAELAGMPGLWVAGALCLFGVIVICVQFLRGDQGGGPLVFCTMLCVFLSQPAMLMIAPDLGKSGGAQLRTLSAIEESLRNGNMEVRPATPQDAEQLPQNVESGGNALPPAIPGLTAPQNRQDATETAPQTIQPAQNATPENSTPQEPGSSQGAPDNTAPQPALQPDEAEKVIIFEPDKNGAAKEERSALTPPQGSGSEVIIIDPQIAPQGTPQPENTPAPQLDAPPAQQN